MKKHLIVLQEGAKDCGAACLRSIIHYYGGNVTLERLIELTKTTKEGTTFYNLKEASEEIGLATKSYRVNDIEKIKEINKKEEPVVFILWGNFARSKKIYITNPKHLVIESPHPSPFSARYGFFGSHPFSRTNQFLKENGQKEIDWQL